MEKDDLKKLFIIGGSSGSLEVLFSVLPQLHAIPHIAIIIVLHRKNSLHTLLSDVFSFRSALSIKEAEEKETITRGTVYIAPADYHLLVEKDGSISLDVSEKVNFSRPSIDVCMETAAEAFREKTVGILLSGANADGVEGMLRIKHWGGVTVAQSPETAEIDYMPKQAVERNAADMLLTPDEIATFINQLSAL